MGQYKTATTKLLYHEELKPIEKLICIDIINLDLQSRDIFITDLTFSKRFNVSISTISRSLKRLKEIGYVEIKNINQGFKKKRYIIPTDKMNMLATELRESVEAYMSETEKMAIEAIKDF